LLANVLSLQENSVSVKPKPTVSDYSDYSIASQPSHSTELSSANLSQRIAELQQKLSSLSSFASIGAAEISQWQSKGMSGGDSDRSSTNISQQNHATEQQIIADLESKIADAQRLASIGEARLNKWRKRTFF
jgi:phycoerythrin-associated linker protein